MINDCTAVILAGGESKRMGRDKIGILLANQSLLNHAIRNMQPLFEALVVSVRQPREHLLCPQLCDNGDAQGPMMGIATALGRVDTKWVFALACDMPFISAEMIVAMADKRNGRDAVVPIVDTMLQPLAAFYSQACLKPMKSQISAGQRSLKTLIGKVNAAIVSEEELRRCDPELLSFMDLDTREDVARAEMLLEMRCKT
ncbi:MAG: molybdenum cofactor guanylyltransferase [Mariprofundaceae bacterium]